MGTIESYEDKGKEHLLNTTTCQGQHRALCPLPYYNSYYSVPSVDETEAR